MNHAIIVAAGKGKRMNKPINKVFLEINGKPMLYYAIKKFQDCSLIDNITIVANKYELKKIDEIKNNYNFTKIRNIAIGGEQRQDSVYNGFLSIKNSNPNDIIVIHNGSNPLIKEGDIIKCINEAKKHKAAVAGFRLKDTIKKVKHGFVKKTISREDIYQIQTPQAIQHGLLSRAFSYAKKSKLYFTDDVSLVEAIGQKVKVVETSYENIKVTNQEDLKIAEGLLAMQKNFKIGIGQDSHEFSGDKNKSLVLGGCTIPNEVGFEANSDGDVILHALFNAISTAIGERSLGNYADKMAKEGITDSREYIKLILNKLSQENLSINNISIMIEAGKPKLEPHTEKIKESLSRILSLEKGNIGIAYTTGEKLTAFGQGKGMQCFAVVSLA